MCAFTVKWWKWFMGFSECMQLKMDTSNRVECGVPTMQQVSESLWRSTNTHNKKQHLSDKLPSCIMTEIAYFTPADQTLKLLEKCLFKRRKYTRTESARALCHIHAINPCSGEESSVQHVLACTIDSDPSEVT